MVALVGDEAQTSWVGHGDRYCTQDHRMGRAVKVYDVEAERIKLQAHWYIESMKAGNDAATSMGFAETMVEQSEYRFAAMELWNAAAASAQHLFAAAQHLSKGRKWNTQKH